MINAEPDQDSMMALEALMKIKSEGFTESTSGNRDYIVQQRPNEVTNSRPKLAHQVVPTQVVSIQPSQCVIPHMRQFRVIPNIPNASVGLSQDQRVHTPPLNAETSPVEHILRQEKIEAALRSKPQRGRKRDNLSVEERLELTRTRNREHAKSTRVRKKARYEELITKESMYDELKEAQNLEEDRIDSVISFIRCREMHHSLSSEACRQAIKNTILPSFTVEIRCVLEDVLDESCQDPLSRLDKLESKIQSKLMEKAFMNGTNVSIGYHIEGGRDSIALSKTGTAIVELSVVGKDTHGNTFTAMTALTKWTFARGSSKLTKTKWITLTDHLTEFAHSMQGLKQQKHYPSVVSLDPNIVSAEEHSRGATPHAEEGSPGMSF